MGETTISWTHTVAPDGKVYPGYSLNLWIGCTRVSPGCANCYAERLNKRFWWNEAGWGKNAARKRTSESYWNQPHKWDKYAAKIGVNLKVFGDSLGDVCDDHPSIKREWMLYYADLIVNTPHLDWLWLTKRPELFNDLWLPMFGYTLPSNLWIGATMENQAMCDKRMYDLVNIPAQTRFISAEPLLGPIDFQLQAYPANTPYPVNDLINWIIVGGESGPNARPMDTAWALDILHQCKLNGVACYFKQMGGNTRINGVYGGDLLDGKEYKEMPR